MSCDEFCSYLCVVSYLSCIVGSLCTYKVQRMISFLFTPFKSLVPCTNVIFAIIEKRITMEFGLNYMRLATLRLSSRRTRERSN